jgi:hypothetical protein
MRDRAEADQLVAEPVLGIGAQFLLTAEAPSRTWNR